MGGPGGSDGVGNGRERVEGEGRRGSEGSGAGSEGVAGLDDRYVFFVSGREADTLYLQCIWTNKSGYSLYCIYLLLASACACDPRGGARTYVEKLIDREGSGSHPLAPISV